MTTFKQLVFVFYGVVMRCKSLNNLCKNLLLLEDKLTYLGIKDLPAVSTLSDANINRNSDVFGCLYQKLYLYYQGQLKPTLCHFKEKLDTDKFPVLILRPLPCLWIFLKEQAVTPSMERRKEV